MATPTKAKVPAPARQHRGYVNQLIQFCQRDHLLGFAASLTDILVEPRFLHAAPLIAPADENLTKSIMYSVPIVPEFPALHAPQHLMSHSIEELGMGDKHIAILGATGSGISTALQAIALWSLNQVNFPIPNDEIQERLNAADKQLRPEDRAERVRENVLMAQQTRENMSISEGKSYVEVMKDEEGNKVRPTLRVLAPLYIHLDDLLLDSPEYGRIIDPAEPFVRALQSQVSYITAQTLAPSIYRLLEQGRALVLMDGLSAQSLGDRTAKLAWLKAFVSQYGDNRIIVTAPPAGAFEMQTIGFSTVHLKAWDETDKTTFLDKLAQYASRITVPVGDTRLQWLKHSRRLLLRDSIFQLVTLNTTTPVEAVTAFLSTLFPTLEAQTANLQRLATMQALQDSISLEKLVEDALAKQKAPTTDTDEGNAQKQRRIQIVRQQKALLDQFVKARILVRRRASRYTFANAAYFGFFASANVTPDEITKHLDNPMWDTVIQFANDKHDLESVVATLLNAPPDIDLRKILKPADWLPYTQSASWKAPYLRLLATLMLAPHQYAATRELLAAALIMSQDDSVLNVFRKMIQNPNADCRKIGALSLGALKDTDALPHLVRLLNDDSDGAVQVGAALALAALNTEPSLNALIAALNNHPNRDVQRAASEALSRFPTLGYAALFDGMKSKEPMVRRASIWGLGRLRTDWAIITLNESYLTDGEWFVQSAVVQVYMDVYEEGALGIHHYPATKDVEWLQKWATKAIREQTIPNNREDIPLVLACIQQKQDLETRLRCIVLSGQMGYLWATDLLYKALYDQQEAIRDSAQRSLVELAYGWNTRLPGVN